MATQIIQVLDSSAMIAHLRLEAGAAIVKQVLADPYIKCFSHAINMAEVYYDTIRFSNETAAEQAIQDLLLLGVLVREDFDESFWKEVGRLKAKYRASLADFCGVVLTNTLGGTFLTADHHEFDKLAADKVCAIQFI